MDSNINIYKRTSVQRPRLLPQNFINPQLQQLQQYNRFDRNSINNMNQHLSGRSEIEMEVYPGPSNLYHFDDDNSESGDRCQNNQNQPIKSNRLNYSANSSHLLYRRNMQDPIIDSSCLEQHASEIVTKLEQDPNLMEDTPASEQLRREVLRDIPQCLTVKRCIKVKLTKSVSQKSKRKPISCFQGMRYLMSFGISKFKADLKNLSYSFELWYGTMKSIEGHFGSGVASYFKLFRWLFLMNFIVAIISIVFITVPQICYSLLIKNNAIYNEREFEFGDIFTGDGSFKNTILYYGYYINETIHLSENLFYSIPHAYFFTMFILYFVSFIILSFSVAGSYRRSYIETEGGLKNVYANKIFCGWDCSIATKEAAKLKSVAIYHELKELLSESMSYKRKQTWFYKLKTFILQFVVNILIIITLAIIGYTTWLLLDKFGYTDDVQSSHMILTAVIINFIMLIVPLIFSYIVRYEEYKNPRTILYVTLFRTYLLSFIIVGVLVAFWLIKAKNNECWETNLGEEIYRLILFDFIISTLFTTIFEIILFMSRRFFKTSLTNLEFNIARHTMQIIYNQTLFWVGLFFSPILPVIVVIKLLITWYIRTISLHKFCKPPTKSWRAAQTQTWFLFMTFFSLLLIIILHGYVIMKIPSSTTCGPFSKHNFIYELITSGISYLEEHHIVWKILMYFTKPGVVALIIIALCVPVYYLRAKSHAERAAVKMLREMLTWQSKDKEFLLKYIDEISNGQWKCNLNDHRFDDPVISLPSLERNRNERASALIHSDSDGSDYTWKYKKYS